MESPAPAARPRGTLWERLVEALGAPNATVAELAAEAARRIAIRAVPGRIDGRGRIASYSSALEASIDHRLWMLEVERGDAETRYVAAVANVDGSCQATAAAKAELDDLRDRERIARTLAPLGRRIALGEALAEAEAELANLTPDAPRQSATAPVAAVRTRHPMAEADGVDFAHKHALREAARANALADRHTPYSQAWQAVDGAERRIEKWDAENPRLLAMLQAERQQQQLAAASVTDSQT